MMKIVSLDHLCLCREQALVPCDACASVLPGVSPDLCHAMGILEQAPDSLRPGGEWMDIIHLLPTETLNQDREP